uniref:Uncharacterized protein n=1 Tax=Physcomitrium patens TaxID=3218 RepID=A0A2K1L0C8_PHYPA|nr:hypothetical protein PHYPA_002263 [Physcomitrium patens]
MAPALSSSVFCFLLLFLTFSCSLVLSASECRAVAHDDNMKEHVHSNKFLANEASYASLGFPTL